MSNARPVVTSSRNSYLSVLEQAWQDHLRPRTDNAPTVISTFAGAGGSSLGYSMAGYRELLAVEWDDNAVATFRMNFPDVPVYHGDIAKLSVDQCLDLAGINPGELDVFDGSPPCQGFSTAGKRILDDPRNQLFREYVRLLRGLRPKVFVMENVSGMVKGKMKLVFAEIMQELKASGYLVSARLLNAMYFNVPQSRERMIFIGVRDDLGIAPSHPKAEGEPYTVRNAIGNLCIIADRHKPGSKLDICCHRLRPGQKADDIYPGWGFQLSKLAWDVPSATIAKSGGATGLIHPVFARKLVGQEYARIASFPDGFRFVGNTPKQQDRIGNSVPPLFMRSIARHVRQAVLDIVISSL